MKLPAEEYRELLRALLGEGQTVTLRLQGLSMGQAIPDGSEARVRRVERVRLGEVALFVDPGGQLVCHRIVRLWQRDGQQWMQTWGDTADRADAPVPVERVLGLVEGVRRPGALRLWLRGLRARWPKPGAARRS